MAVDTKRRIVHTSANRRGWYIRRCRAIAVGALSGVLACGGVADEGKLPPNVQDPATLQTPSGALGRYRGALAQLPGAFDRVMMTGAVLTDELTALPTRVGMSGLYTALDSRFDPSSFGDLPAQRLHLLRAQAREARGFLQAHLDTLPDLRGHLYVEEGYAAIFLADLFCSGIPLSTVDYGGSYTLAAGSTTREVYRHAVALFDTASTLINDSVSFKHWADLGRARALLALGRYDSAAAAVATVPDDYVYQVVFQPGPFAFGEGVPDSARLWHAGLAFRTVTAMPGMGDREGGNGLDYRSSGDPRTVAELLGQDQLGNDMYFPAKYLPLDGPVTLTIASGIEARLIEAEAALHAAPEDGRWLALLNRLRETAWSTIVPATGPLASLDDPGPAGQGVTPARVDQLFRERAFWLYLTGHRLGDLRRLIRDYGRGPNAVYPVGAYRGGGGTYGGAVVLPTPASERALNSKYTGCFDQGA